MGVVFNEPVTGSARRKRQVSGLSRFVIRLGLAKTEAGAQTIMLFAAILLIVFSVFMFSHAAKPLPTPPPKTVNF